jgi:hypothetical protein
MWCKMRVHVQNRKIYQCWGSEVKDQPRPELRKKPTVMSTIVRLSLAQPICPICQFFWEYSTCSRFVQAVGEYYDSYSVFVVEHARERACRAVATRPRDARSDAMRL